MLASSHSQKGRDVDTTELKKEIEYIRSVRKDRIKLVERLKSKSPLELSQLFPYFYSAGVEGEEFKAIRDTAYSVLERKLADTFFTELSSLGISIDQLHKTIKEYQESSHDQARKMIVLTWVIAILTVILVVGLCIQIYLTVK
jgi:hypothetical protein